MAENSRFLRALQRIAETARRINPKPRSNRTIQLTTAPTVLTALPQHKPLLPLLISHSIPTSLARACADRYDGYAIQLRSEAERKLVPYITGAGDGQCSAIYSVFLKDYNRTLRRWSQTILNTALKKLKRDSVELGDWDVILPPPLWLPSPPDQSFTQERTKKYCYLSSAPRPAHAFPTTYPPTIRPLPGVFSADWLRFPATNPSPPFASDLDLDSLCSRFATTLTIDENPRLQSQSTTSIFSLPAAVGEGHSIVHSCITPAKMEHSRTRATKLSSTIKPNTPLPVASKPRHLSLPPRFPSPYANTRPAPRKASSPARFPSSRRALPSPQPPDPSFYLTPAPPSNTPTINDQEPSPSTSLCSEPFSGYAPSGADCTSRGSLHPTGPTTPPTLLPELFSEPVVVPPTPDFLSPVSSLLPISDPFLPFQTQDYGCAWGPLAFPFDHGGLVPGFALEVPFAKSAFDAHLGFDHFFRDTPARAEFDLIGNSLNACSV